MLIVFTCDDCLDTDLLDRQLNRIACPYIHKKSWLNLSFYTIWRTYISHENIYKTQHESILKIKKTGFCLLAFIHQYKSRTIRKLEHLVLFYLLRIVLGILRRNQQLNILRYKTYKSQAFYN